MTDNENTRKTRSLEGQGLPAGENSLEEGIIYEVENFFYCSWGFLAQLKREDAQASKQFRLTTVKSIDDLKVGGHYQVKIVEDDSSALGVKAYLTKV